MADLPTTSYSIKDALYHDTLFVLELILEREYLFTLSAHRGP
jgi:hypothetical protein